MPSYINSRRHHGPIGEHMTTDAIARCHVCDDQGLTPSKRVCHHTAAQAAAVRGAEMARREIRPTKDTTPKETQA